MRIEIERLSRQLQGERAETEIHAQRIGERAREEGRLAASLQAETQVNESFGRVDRLLRSLEEETRRYTLRVERDVVMLALDIARRVLRHESQVDRLLLAGAVRATLDAVREGGKVKVLVPLADLAAWQVELGALCFEGKQILIEGDPVMKAGQCSCRLSTGTLDLSWAAQLGEIERTFENILRRRELVKDADSLTREIQNEAPSG
jgi:flagellar assembly protein FliH